MQVPAAAGLFSIDDRITELQTFRPKTCASRQQSVSARSRGRRLVSLAGRRDARLSALRGGGMDGLLPRLGVLRLLAVRLARAFSRP
jgi:hypothetical protein